MPNQESTKPGAFQAREVVQCLNLVSYQPGAVVSREIIKKGTGKVTVFAFDADEGLSEHTSPYDALVQVLEGSVEITIAGQPYKVSSGEMLLMPAQQPHALKALERFKMILTMVR